MILASMRWIGLLLVAAVGTIVAAYLSMVIEIDRTLRGSRRWRTSNRSTLTERTPRP